MSMTLLRKKTEEFEKALDRPKLRASASQVSLGQSSPLASGSAAVLRPKAFSMRRWTVDLTAEEDSMCSPKWAKSVERKASNRLVMEEADCDRSFAEVCGRLQSLVDQTVMRTLKFFSRIRDSHKEEPAMLKEPQNLERLTSVSFLVATVNSRLSKWLHQLDPQANVKPARPGRETERTVEELLRDINFTLSRMAVLASSLVPKLREILSDAKASKVDASRLLDGPLSPGRYNPERLAQRRGIHDVHELEGLISHLERILEVSHALAFRPAGKVRIPTTVVLASNRFKKLLVEPNTEFIAA